VPAAAGGAHRAEGQQRDRHVAVCHPCVDQQRAVSVPPVDIRPADKFCEPSVTGRRVVGEQSNLPDCTVTLTLT